MSRKLSQNEIPKELTLQERKRFERALKKIEKQTQPLIDAIRESENITDEDLKIFITNKC